MASSRGFLNIQSLNELTSENSEFLLCGISPFVKTPLLCGSSWCSISVNFSATF